MKRNPVTSKFKKSNLLILLIGGVGMMLVSYFVIKRSISDDYVQITEFTSGIILGLVGIGCLTLIFFTENLVFENRKLKIYSLTGKLKREISATDIESYKEIEKENKYSKWKDLTIFTKGSKYKISSYSHSNYESLRRALIKGKNKNSYAEKMWQYKMNKRYGIGFSIIGFLLILFFGNTYLKKDLDVSPDNLTTIEGKVLNNVKIKKSGGRNRSRSIEIELEEYPNFKFKIGNNGLNATKANSLIKNIQKGDIIKIDILKDQFQKKITKEVPLGFWDKGVNYRNIGIYGLKDKQNSYFNLRQFNRNRKSDRNSWAMYLLLGFSFFMLGYGIYELIKNKKPVAKYG
ncbi:MAG: hypothetical protein AAF741_17160 [Bacteroidota bacterium]